MATGASVAPTWQRSIESGEAQSVLLGHIGPRPFALPTSAIEQLLRMATLTPLPGAPPHLPGLLNLRGAVLPVVAPHLLLHLPPPLPHPDQHLIVLAATTRFILWVERAEQVISVPAALFDRVAVARDGALAPFVFQHEGLITPLLAPEKLDPGTVVHCTTATRS